MRNFELSVQIVSALLIYWARIAELKKRREVERGTVRENLTLRLFVAVGTLMLAGSIAEQLWFRTAFNPACFAAGWAMALGSFMLRRRAIRELGKMWSLHVEIRERHQLVVTGPYRWVRHPAYTSMILELSSLGLLLHSTYTSLLVAFLFIPTLILRIRLEEAALREQVAGYAEYQRATPALVPYKLPGIAS
jgi:protein-S-isoprenylcysteine O-methyltransferase Ste14